MDKTFYTLYKAAFQEGLKALAQCIDSKRYIQPHYQWYEVSYDKEFPSFSGGSYLSHTRYSSTFTFHSINDTGAIDVEKIPSLVHFIKYCREHKDVLINYISDFILKNELYDKEYSIISGMILRLVTQSIERYYEIHNSLIFDEEKYLEITQPIFNKLFSDRLSFDFVIPILFVKFHFDQYDFSASESIVKLKDDFQQSRAHIKGYSPAIADSVIAAATHHLY